MSINDLLILLIVLLFTVSGIIINLRGKKTNEIITLEDDNKTLFLFRLIIPLSIVISLTCYFSGIGSIKYNTLFIYAGYFLVLAGFIIRWISFLSLGPWFSVSVCIQKDQKLKTNGLYKKVRHPSYTGLIIYYWGLGLIMQNWISILVLVIFPFIVVFIRIKQEEKVMINHFSHNYQEYKKNTSRLFPYLY